LRYTTKKMFITYLLNPRCSRLRRAKSYQIAQLRIDSERNAALKSKIITIIYVQNSV